jgi:hypothetical protein
VKNPIWGKKLALGLLVTALAVIGMPMAANATPIDTVCASGCAYTTIQAAVTAASPGDTITIAAGTYAEDVTVAKALTINGVQSGVDARSRTGTETVVRSMAVTASNVVLDGLSFNKVGTQLTVASPSAPTILSGVVVRNSIFDGYSNVGIIPDRAGNITLQRLRFKNPAAGSEPMQIKSNGVAGGCTGTQVLDSQFDYAANNGSSDINFSCTGSASTNITVSGNAGNTNDADGSSLVAFSGVAGGITVSDNTASTSGSQVFFFGSMTGTASITGNTFTGGTSSAVAIFGGDAGTSDTPNTGTFFITNNDLSGNARAIRVTASGLSAAGKVMARSNTLSGSTITGIANASPGTVDASGNWWGSASGPAGGATVGSNIVTTPWCNEAACDSITSDFENFGAGSPNGQGSWKFSGTSDVEVVSGYSGAPAAFGTKSIRISNAVVTGGFSDQLFSASVNNEAGETEAQNGGLSGGTRRNSFSAIWQFASATPTVAQPGLAVTVSPDRGDGARMSFIRMRDETNGLAVDFVDVPGTSNPADFVETTLASGLDRTVAHTIRLELILNDGASNDYALVYVDDLAQPVHFGTTWENYFRNDSEGISSTAGHPSTVDSLIFRLNGTPQPAYAGGGFLLDNVKLKTQALSSEAAATGLTPSSGTLVPAFDPAVTSYTVNVANSVSTMLITMSLPWGGTFGCGGYTTPQAISVGANVIECLVA